MNPNELNVALIQCDLSWENQKTNYEHVRNLIHSTLEKNSNEKPDLILLPETFATGFTMRSERIAEPDEGPTETFLQEIANFTRATICAGWIRKNQYGKPLNTVSVVNPKGIIILRYSKIYPFTFGGEDRHYSAGSEIFSYDLNGFRITPFICYDIRFPEIFRKVAGDTDVFTVHANWPVPRIHHWELILKTRAIENQAYVFGVNRIGIAGYNQSVPHNGHSLAVAPNGDFVDAGEGNETILFYKAHKNSILDYRKNFPVLLDRKDPNLIGVKVTEHSSQI
ncbi:MULTISPECIES: carbon-nitrogen family hydrolase [Leptospira]|uniref:Amidohydrolase n=1 Tax=Leptospira kirschneri serovar Pomona TaxID=561005 RepID=A0A1T1DGA8_9LEPT|nr:MULTISPECIES: carbon-nitrogen family hydrolase [Leptospira]EMJ89933.1 hydrolase, carbon-nitrogen family [Leptospira kirschneri str. JB]EMK03488.1 hydrolase, carbon-nitrogen family [Leptospira kirschneri]KXZ28624.1 amidohydrolase [Leptospira kirschneri]KXZ33271.1 amidohydrolase [Leptospira sp. ZV016]OOV39889.1 amidohydrolase [Leptospira kirschneri serovar Pomona]